MKKLSDKQKYQRQKRAERLVNRRLRRVKGRRLVKLEPTPELMEAKKLFEKQINAVGKHPTELRKVPVYGLRKVYDAPKVLDFNENYSSTLSYLLGLRRFNFSKDRQKRGSYFEFQELENISPSALLVLTAELDCILGVAKNLIKKYRTPADSHRWNPHITALFHDFGVFELLRTKPSLRMTYGERLKAVSFRIGKTQDGGAALNLIRDITEVSEKKPNSTERLYEGLGEALANVLDHAYPHSHVCHPGKRIKAWWAGAIYDENLRTTHFMVYDRGIGLPESLPETRGFKTLLERLGLKNGSDADLIWAATQKPTSGTHLEYRGEGLRQMADVVDNHKGSSLHIISGKGEMTYLGEKRKILKDLSVEFCGTLIEWRIKHD